MKKTALILATAVAGLLSLCAGLFTYGYFLFHDIPERSYFSRGPNAAWAEHKWVNAIQPDAAYGKLAATLRRNRITDVYFYMGWPEASGDISIQEYSAAPVLLRELRAQAPNLRMHAWIGQVEKRGGGPLDLSDATVRRHVTAMAAHFIALGFDGIHYGFPGVGSGNPHLLMLLDQTRLRLAESGATLSIAADALEPIPGLAWMARQLGSQNGFWTRRYYASVARRVDQIAVVPANDALPAEWLTSDYIAWQTRSIRPLTAGRATLFIGVPSAELHDDGTADRTGLIGPTLAGIRKGMTALGNDAFDNFGVALDVNGDDIGNGNHVLLEHWLDAGNLVAR